MIALAQRPDGSQRVWCDGCRAQAVAPKGRAEPDGWSAWEKRGHLGALFCERCSRDGFAQGLGLLESRLRKLREPPAPIYETREGHTRRCLEAR